MPRQKELFPIICEIEDDNGEICNRKVSKIQHETDGMCHHCADQISMFINDQLDKVIHDPKRKQHHV